jgi:hypothetical protein
MVHHQTDTTVGSIGINRGQDPCGMLSTAWRVYAQTNMGCSEGKRGCNSILGRCSAWEYFGMDFQNENHLELIVWYFYSLSCPTIIFLKHYFWGLRKLGRSNNYIRGPNSAASW